MATAAPASRRNAHDLREGGSWTLKQTLKNHFLYAGARILLLLLGPAPTAVLRTVGRGLGRALYILRCGPRRIALENLARAFPDLPESERRAICSRVFERLGSYLGETVAQLVRPRRFVTVPFEEGSRDVLETALRSGRGVVFASAHLGPWERIAGSLVRQGFPLTTVARESYDPRFLRVYDRLRAGSGVRVIYRGAGSAAQRLVRTLRHGGLLGVPMDLRSRVPSVDCPFLGISARTPIGPARIALRTGAAVVVGTAVPARRCGEPARHARDSERSGDRDVELVLRVTRINTTDLAPNACGAMTLTRRLNDELSNRIRAFPEGWLWMHPRFETDLRTDDEPSAPPRRLQAGREQALEENWAPPGEETRYTSEGTRGGARRRSVGRS